MSQDTFLSGPYVSASAPDRQLALAAAPVPEDSLITMRIARLEQRIQALEERLEIIEQGRGPSSDAAVEQTLEPQRGPSQSSSTPQLCIETTSSDSPSFWKVQLICRYPDCRNTFTSEYGEGDKPFKDAEDAGWEKCRWKGRKSWKNPMCSACARLPY
jgi:hypothetical protein